MTILEKWGKAIEALDEKSMDECLHDDYQFTLHSAGKVLSKSDVIQWAMSGDISRDNFFRWKHTSCISLFNL